MVEYAYFDRGINGNSNEIVEYLIRMKKFFDSGVITEIGFTSGNTSLFAIREPIPLAVKVKGDIGEARFQALKLLKDLGYVRKDVYNLEEIFKFIERIEKMPLEEFLKEIRKLKSQI